MSINGGYVIFLDFDKIDEDEFPSSEIETYEMHLKDKMCFFLLIGDELSNYCPENLSFLKIKYFHEANHYASLIRLRDLKRNLFSGNRNANLTAFIAPNALWLPGRGENVQMATRTCPDTIPSYLKNWQQLLLLYCFDQKCLNNCFF
jgi:hypothetical protein